MLAGIYKAASDAAKSVGPTIGQTYQNAANSQAAYGQAYSGAFKQAENQSADQLNSLLGKWGNAPTVQGDKGGADVLYGLGGSIPATNLSTQGAAFKSAADFLPSNYLLRGADAVRLDQQNVLKQNRDYANQLKVLDAKYPGLAQQVYMQLAQQQTQSNAADVNRAIAIFQATGKVTPDVTRLLGIPPGTKTLSQQRLEQQGKAAAAKLKLPNAGLSKLYGFVVDSNGDPVMGADGKPQAVATKSPSAPKANVALSKAFGFLVDSAGNPITRGGKVVYLPKTKKPSYTASQTNKYKGRATTIAEGAFNGVPESRRGAGDALPPVDYKEAINEMEKAGLPAAVYLPVLNKVYNKPGQRGRPYTGQAPSQDFLDFIGNLFPVQ